MASVFAMISLANELLSSSALKFEARGALQVVEAVAVLQLLQLVLEHEVEGRAEHAAERHLLLGQAADPQVDGVDAGDRSTPFGAVAPRRRCCSGSRGGRSGASVAVDVRRRSTSRRGALVRRCVVAAGDRADACRRRR